MLITFSVQIGNLGFVSFPLLARLQAYISPLTFPCMIKRGLTSHHAHDFIPKIVFFEQLDLTRLNINLGSNSLNPNSSSHPPLPILPPSPPTASLMPPLTLARPAGFPAPPHVYCPPQPSFPISGELLSPPRHPPSSSPEAIVAGSTTTPCRLLIACCYRCLRRPSPSPRWRLVKPPPPRCPATTATLPL